MAILVCWFSFKTVMYKINKRLTNTRFSVYDIQYASMRLIFMFTKKEPKLGRRILYFVVTDIYVRNEVKLWDILKLKTIMAVHSVQVL